VRKHASADSRRVHAQPWFSPASLPLAAASPLPGARSSLGSSGTVRASAPAVLVACLLATSSGDCRNNLPSPQCYHLVSFNSCAGPHQATRLPCEHDTPTSSQPCTTPLCDLTARTKERCLRSRCSSPCGAAMMAAPRPAAPRAPRRPARRTTASRSSSGSGPLRTRRPASGVRCSSAAARRSRCCPAAAAAPRRRPRRRRSPLTTWPASARARTPSSAPSAARSWTTAWQARRGCAAGLT